MDVTFDALKALLARERIARPAEAARINVDRWREARLDLACLADVHRAVVGDRESVRRILADGSSILAPAQPGHVRTKPQAFRAGDYVERAWEQGVLRSGLGDLFRTVTPLVADDPVRAAAQLVWALSRAQPFTGMNERVALVLASSVLRRAGLPVLDIERIERDPAFEAALVVASVDDRSGLERYLVDAIWDEALALVETVAPVPPPEAPRWTLADEHAAAAGARARATRLSADELTAFVDDASTMLERDRSVRCGIMLGPARREWLESHTARLACAWEAAIRGRRLSPHAPMIVARWTVACAHGIELKLVTGDTGRGMTGAAAAHLALEAPGDPVAQPSLGILLVADESRDARHARTGAWLDRALAGAIRQCPLRLTARNAGAEPGSPRKLDSCCWWSPRVVQ